MSPKLEGGCQAVDLPTPAVCEPRAHTCEVCPVTESVCKEAWGGVWGSNSLRYRHADSTGPDIVV